MEGKTQTLVAETLARNKRDGDKLKNLDDFGEDFDKDQDPEKSLRNI